MYYQVEMLTSVRAGCGVVYYQVEMLTSVRAGCGVKLWSCVLSS